ncbi:CGNR zinc finger domain-containing protein [Pseudarthrobacter sulfonivorans]|uniref:CGNR zinc finger domain-containing protein n=1 Tax=Pseudarthrobacter sulfonivorans TaxID=121292 RepID=UPI00286BE860|nr:CGNR zinc finger domain-containing protein [Pseudarthrobacter sulfonivorans]
MRAVSAVIPTPVPPAESTDNINGAVPDGGPKCLVTPRVCEAESCGRFFLRTHARRQWSSTRCGDRVRAARA